jgi:hypothetical protein
LDTEELTLFAEYCHIDKMKKDEMGLSCIISKRGKTYLQNYSQEGKGTYIPLGRHRRRRKEILK